MILSVNFELTTCVSRDVSSAGLALANSIFSIDSHGINSNREQIFDEVISGGGVDDLRSEVGMVGPGIPHHLHTEISNSACL